MAAWTARMSLRRVLEYLDKTFETKFVTIPFIAYNNDWPVKTVIEPQVTDRAAVIVVQFIGNSLD